jgi:hypothetical protein
MYGLTRGMTTLIGAACAGLLLWLATRTDNDSLGGYWAYLGLIAAAGLTMAASQLLGGWTKWGWPRISGSVFLLGFVPGLVAGGLVLLAAQPDTGAWGTGWAGDLGLGGLADDLTAVIPAIAFGLGLLFGLTFDTTGPRVREVDVVAEREEPRSVGYAGPAPIYRDDADEPVAAERAAGREGVAVPDRDADGIDDRTEDPGARQPEPRRRRLFSRH